MYIITDKVSRSGLAATLLIAVLAGCGSDTGDNNSARKKQMEDYAKSVGLNVEVSEDGEDTTVRLDNPGLGNTVVGNNLELPEGFPDDVVMHPGTKIQSVNQMLGGYMLTGQSESDVDDIADFFKSALTAKGWQPGPENAETSQLRTLHFTKDDRLTNIMLIPTGDTISVQLNTMPNPG